MSKLKVRLFDNDKGVIVDQNNVNVYMDIDEEGVITAGYYLDNGDWQDLEIDVPTGCTDVRLNEIFDRDVVECINKRTGKTQFIAMIQGPKAYPEYGGGLGFSVEKLVKAFHVTVFGRDCATVFMHSMPKKGQPYVNRVAYLKLLDIKGLFEEHKNASDYRYGQRLYHNAMTALCEILDQQE